MEARFENVRRHPLCPNCGYDLVATIEAGHRVCPECGCEFEPAELDYQQLPGDWTAARGIRRAGVSLLIRVVPATAIWFGYTWFCNTILRQIGIILRWVGFMSVIAGILIGVVLIWKLSYNAGFSSKLLAVLAVLFAAIVIGTGGLLVHLLITPLTSAFWLHAAIGAVAAAAMIAWIQTIES